ncbi:MAG TPA: hypothetical protein VIU87_07120 [Mycobacterium sp.]
MSEDAEPPPPPIPDGPPYSHEFLAALHGGLYDDDTAPHPHPEHDPLNAVWDRVRRDPDAAEFLDLLDEVTRDLGRLDDD